jgi:hypothetical protein
MLAYMARSLGFEEGFFLDKVGERMLLDVRFTTQMAGTIPKDELPLSQKKLVSEGGAPKQTPVYFSRKVRMSRIAV